VDFAQLGFGKPRITQNGALKNHQLPARVKSRVQQGIRVYWLPKIAASNLKNKESYEMSGANSPDKFQAERIGIRRIRVCEDRWK
jgi:hypothetical protein